MHLDHGLRALGHRLHGRVLALRQLGPDHRQVLPVRLPLQRQPGGVVPGGPDFGREDSQLLALCQRRNRDQPDAELGSGLDLLRGQLAMVTFQYGACLAHARSLAMDLRIRAGLNDRQIDLVGGVQVVDIRLRRSRREPGLRRCQHPCHDQKQERRQADHRRLPGRHRPLALSPRHP